MSELLVDISKDLKDFGIQFDRWQSEKDLYEEGKVEEALNYLEPAAAAMSNEPMVQYHLGATLLAADRPTGAVEALRRSVALLGPLNRIPREAQIRAALKDAEAAAAAAASENQ